VNGVRQPCLRNACSRRSPDNRVKLANLSGGAAATPPRRPPQTPHLRPHGARTRQLGPEANPGPGGR